MTRRTTDNAKAVQAFLSVKQDIDAMLDRLKALSEEHFNASPDEIHWGHLWTAPAMQELSLAR